MSASWMVWLRRGVVVAVAIAPVAGTTACGSSVECGAGTSEVNGACVARAEDAGAQCGAGTFRDGEGRCVASSDAGGVRCGAGTVLGPAGECVAVAVEAGHGCGPGTSLDPSGLCVAVAPDGGVQCGPGTHLNDSQECVPDPLDAAAPCGAGTHLDPSGVCVPDPVDAGAPCGVGTHLDPSGVCVPDPVDAGAPCGVGTHLDPSGVCLPDPQEAGVRCGAGTHLDPSGACLADPQEAGAGCGAGTHLDPSGVCLPDPQEAGVRCGAGTHLDPSGVCLPDPQEAGVRCGAGTVLDPSGKCVIDAPDGFGLCDPATTILVMNDAGEPVCVAGRDCNTVPPCPAPAPDKVTVCGRIFDAATTAALDDGNDQNGTPSSEVALRVLDLLDLASNPAGATPIGSAVVDGCGYYLAENLPPPSSGFAALSIDDVAAASSYVQTVVPLVTTAGKASAGTRAFVARGATVAAWDSSAGLTGGSSFASSGATLFLYEDTTAPAVAPLPGAPVAGVTIVAQGTVSPQNDFYFCAGSGPLDRSTICPGATATSSNGAGLFINGSLTTYGGSGAEPAGCTWPQLLSAVIPGVVLVREMPSVCN